MYAQHAGVLMLEMRSSKLRMENKSVSEFAAGIVVQVLCIVRSLVDIIPAQTKVIACGTVSSVNFSTSQSSMVSWHAQVVEGVSTHAL
jgi:hypothetical protein